MSNLAHVRNVCNNSKNVKETVLDFPKERLKRKKYIQTFRDQHGRANSSRTNK